MSTIAAITLDLDDTLWPIMPTIHRAEHAVLDWIADHCPKAAVDRQEMERLRQQVAQDQPELAHDFSLMRTAALRAALLPVGYGEAQVEQAFEVFFSARQQVDLFDDAEPALRELTVRYRLAAISNGNAQLDRIGIDHYFEHAVNARQVGRAKPHPAIFETAVQALALSPAQIVHVGDHPHEDIDGAKNAGFKTIWLNRDGNGEHPRADATIGSLSELPVTLQRLQGGT